MRHHHKINSTSAPHTETPSTHEADGRREVTLTIDPESAGSQELPAGCPWVEPHGQATCSHADHEDRTVTPQGLALLCVGTQSCVSLRTAGHLNGGDVSQDLGWDALFGGRRSTFATTSEWQTDKMAGRRMLVGAASAWIAGYLATYLVLIHSQGGSPAWWYIALLGVAIGMLSLVVAGIIGRRALAATSAGLAFAAVIALASIGILLTPALACLIAAWMSDRRRKPAAGVPGEAVGG